MIPKILRDLGHSVIVDSGRDQEGKQYVDICFSSEILYVEFARRTNYPYLTPENYVYKDLRGSDLKPTYSKESLVHRAMGETIEVELKKFIDELTEDLAKASFEVLT